MKTNHSSYSFQFFFRDMLLHDSSSADDRAGGSDGETFVRQGSHEGRAVLLHRR